jgi:hypothetical protein
MSERYEIKGVEVFGAGVHNGALYTMKDLDDLVDAFGRAGYHVPIKVGHVDDVGAPAWGWVANLRRVGGRLLADFVDLTRETYDLIRTRRYGQVSVEIWTNLKNAAGTFRRALKCVALLGAEIPAVPGLKPAWENLSVIDYGAIKVYTVSWRWTGMARMVLDPHAAGLEVDRRAQRFAMERNLSYSDAKKAVLQEDRTLAADYLGTTHPQQPRIVGEEVHRLTLAHMVQTGLRSYSHALHDVLGTHPDLAREYAEGAEEANRT